MQDKLEQQRAARYIAKKGTGEAIGNEDFARISNTQIKETIEIAKAYLVMTIMQSKCSFMLVKK